ncbi:MAG: hypothetical protein HY344_04665 [Candidatus Levybacteria bacterium]|nr:hypothetical protein [Candidatus Levybacteria bacterium]
MNPDLLKNRKVQIAGIVVVALVVLLSAFVFFRNGNQIGQNVNTNILPTEIPIPTILPEELGLTLEAGPKGQTVIVSVANTQGISAIEYELSYLAGDLPRGAIGQIDVSESPATKEVTLGTCSDVCHYDKDVSGIKVILKVTKDDGSVFQSSATLDSI